MQVIGVSLTPHVHSVTKQIPSLPEAAAVASSGSVSALADVTSSIASIILPSPGRKHNAPKAELAGPIGVIQMGARSLEQDPSSWCLLCALISFNVAAMNTIPFPGLDGGQMAFLVAEAVRGRKVPRKYQDAVNSMAILLLAFLTVSLLVSDMRRLI